MPRRRLRRPSRAAALLTAIVLFTGLAAAYQFLYLPSHPRNASEPFRPEHSESDKGPISTTYHLSPTPSLPLITEFPAEPEPALTPSPTLPTPGITSATLQPQPGTPSTPLPHAKNARLSIVIDDMGQDVPHTKEAMETLPAAVTFAFLPYPPDSPRLAEKAKQNSHVIIVHLPTEPLSSAADPGPNTLLAADDEETLKTKISNNLKPLNGIAVGVNNHMGSKFTQSLPGMRILLQELDKQGYFFLDSLTINPTATRKAAQGLELPLLTRHVFLDHIPEEAKVKQELDKAVRHAQTHGNAIAIGHPHPATLKVLQDNLGNLPANVTLVPLTDLLP